MANLIENTCSKCKATGEFFLYSKGWCPLCTADNERWLAQKSDQTEDYYSDEKDATDEEDRVNQHNEDQDINQDLEERI